MDEKTVGVIGYGRFGQFWADVLAADFQVIVHDVTPVTPREPIKAMGLAELCASVQTLFLCVPIRQMEAVVAAVAPHMRPGMTVMDTCSVKVEPVKAMLRALSPVPGVDLIATHPMFGPDSAADGLGGLTIVMYPLRTSSPAYEQWRDYFSGRGLQTVNMTPEEHDRLAAYSQGVTHYIGRILGELNLQPTPIDTEGTRLLQEIVTQTCNDSWALFTDLQQRNPYTAPMRRELEAAMERVYTALLPKPEAQTALVVGIQGGEGSFNEEACRHYAAAHDIAPVELRYLYTADNVLEALHTGQIDRGVFALQNAQGGVVLETVHGMSRYRCELVDIFEIVISHCLLIHPQADPTTLDTVISHPQALAQCRDTLQARYPQLERKSGAGDRIDQALCASHLAAGDLPPTTAVLAPGVCAELFGLRTLDSGLQDLGEENLTTFVWAKRREYFR
jgi:prephenate dehydrogenase